MLAISFVSVQIVRQKEQVSNTPSPCFNLPPLLFLFPSFCPDMSPLCHTYLFSPSHIFSAFCLSPLSFLFSPILSHACQNWCRGGVEKAWDPACTTCPHVLLVQMSYLGRCHSQLGPDSRIPHGCDTKCGGRLAQRGRTKISRSHVMGTEGAAGVPVWENLPLRRRGHDAESCLL